MLQYFKKFVSAEDGAITVDWVVLTAATVGLGLIILVAIKPSALAKADNISDVIAATDP
ncbi:hypothetical protein [Loktanella sp. R86503]|uniref:hypothetical protein n=1 Tax=Loktanella sp. R86503 TaxID=3093847 RepID=UPI0036DD72E0